MARGFVVMGAEHHAPGRRCFQEMTREPRKVEMAVSYALLPSMNDPDGDGRLVSPDSRFNEMTKI
jgi:hypothetical protein